MSTAIAEPSSPPARHHRGGARFTFHRGRRGPWIQGRMARGLELNRLELSLPELPEPLIGLRLLHLTDLHLRRRWPAGLDPLIAQTHQNPPDLILCTGDFVDDKRDHRPALPLVERLLHELRSRHGIYAVLGNHDGDLLAPWLIHRGVRMIMHRRIEIQARGCALELIGLPGVDRVDLDERFIASQPPRRREVPRIILCHYPDLIRPAASLAADLYLAGHTHGGQMCLPGQIPLLTHDRLPRRFSSGAHEWNGCCLLVGRGMGCTGVPLRLFCPAEAVEVELRRDEGRAFSILHS